MIRTLSRFLGVMLAVFMTVAPSAFADTEGTVVDVTDLVQVTQSRMRYDRRAGTSYLDITLTNTSDMALVGPVLLVVDSVTNSSVTVKDPDGTTGEGTPFITVVASDAILQAGESSGSKRLTFDNNTRARFNFTVSTWSSAVADAAEVVGAEGGIVEVKAIQNDLSGTKLYIPKDAVTEQILFEIQRVDNPISYLLPTTACSLIDIQPDGAQFINPASLTLRYKDDDNDGLVDGKNILESRLRPFTCDEETKICSFLKIDSQDTTANFIEFKINHLCVFGLAVDNHAEGLHIGRRGDIDFNMLDFRYDYTNSNKNAIFKLKSKIPYLLKKNKISNPNKYFPSELQYFSLKESISFEIEDHDYYEEINNSEEIKTLNAILNILTVWKKPIEAGIYTLKWFSNTIGYNVGLNEEFIRDDIDLVNAFTQKSINRSLSIVDSLTNECVGTNPSCRADISVGTNIPSNFSMLSDWNITISIKVQRRPPEAYGSEESVSQWNYNNLKLVITNEDTGSTQIIYDIANIRCNFPDLNMSYPKGYTLGRHDGLIDVGLEDYIEIQVLEPILFRHPGNYTVDLLSYKSIFGEQGQEKLLHTREVNVSGDTLDSFGYSENIDLFNYDNIENIQLSFNEYFNKAEWVIDTYIINKDNTIESSTYHNGNTFIIDKEFEAGKIYHLYGFVTKENDDWWFLKDSQKFNFSLLLMRKCNSLTTVTHDSLHTDTIIFKDPISDKVIFTGQCNTSPMEELIFSEDFESGVNLWNIAFYNQGSSTVVTDSTNPTNNVLKINGTPTGHRILKTTTWEADSLNGFHLSADYLHESTTLYHPWIGIRQGDGLFAFGRIHPNEQGLATPANPYVESGLRILDPTDWSNRIYDERTAENAHDSIPANRWLTLELWHDVTTDEIIYQISDRDNNETLMRVAHPVGTDVDLSSEAGDSLDIMIGVEETTAQYFDNISLSIQD